MSVTAIFNTVEGQALSIDNAIGLRKTLFLRGAQLVDADGLIVAELVESSCGRKLWHLIAGTTEAFDTDNGLYQEVAIIGQGRLNL